MVGAILLLKNVSEVLKIATQIVSILIMVIQLLKKTKMAVA